MTMTHSLLEIRNLAFNYGKQAILSDLNISVPKGSIYGYLGRNGSGKTTTIRLIFKFLKAQHGTISFNGKNIHSLNHEYFKQVSLQSQPLALYDHLTTMEQIKYVNQFFDFDKTAIDKTLKDVDMYQHRNVKIKHMSSGMKQRVAIACSLLQDAELLVLDEPINGLDPNGIHEFRELILNLNKQGITIFMSSHILSEMQKMCTNVGILDSGKLILEDSMTNINKQFSSSLTLHTSNTILAKELLIKNGFSDNICIQKEELICPIQNDLDYAQIIKLLSAESIDIYNIERNQADLESIYLQLTKQS
jgi:ABC-2 type transport system ATP-binding protein